ncbi:tRNA uracil 4-sulfurtransferase ThiI [Paenibacillus shirakamiensis]|uniref:tRNA uracil 4-sulfurtransferase ThiI n=1 Tax=Paenibacillus shirakamiensis TaxID=1265935 RepID=UPI001AE264AD
MRTYDLILLRFGEIAIKGKNRKRFEKAAYMHIQSLLSAFPKAVIRKEFGRFYIELHGESAERMVPELQKVFGIESVSPVIAVPSELSAIIAAARQYLSEYNLQAPTLFKVNARRVWKGFEHSSHEMNRLVSGPLLHDQIHLKVDVHHPDFELRVEVREDQTYIFSEVLPGAGGYPLGTNGKAVLLLSGGIDSPVAGWSAMRRGLEVECVHFHSYPFTSKKAEEKVIRLAHVLASYAGSIRLHLVPFTEVQTLFTQAKQDNLMITLMRRAMLRIASNIAEQESALALVTGDSLGQVASQTLPSMNVIGRATDLPLLRPLVMMDKAEIIELSKQIGTFDLSILPYEDCCSLFIPKSPSTNPNLRIINKIESVLPGLDDHIKAAVEGTRTIVIQAGDKLTFDQEVEQEQWF